MPTAKKSQRKKKLSKHKKKLVFKNKGFSALFIIVVVAIGIFLAGAFESTQTVNPVQAIPDPGNFADPTGKESLQLKTLGFITVTPSPTSSPTSAPTLPPTPQLCQQGGANDEPEILVGYSPGSGQTVSAGGQIKVWVNDEGQPIIAPGEQVDATTGQITTPGNRTAKAGDGYLWEPALYISPQTAETGGTPHFPTMIKGDYDNNNGNGPGYHVAGMDPVPGNPHLSEQYTAEDIWDVNSLGLAPGTYTAEFVIHDGDDNRGVGCVTITIQ